MISYIIRRLLGAIPTLFIITIVAFFMMRIAPGGPFDGERRLPPEIERNVKAAYDLDKPLLQQFLDINPMLCGVRFNELFGSPPDASVLTDAGLTAKPRLLPAATPGGPRERSRFDDYFDKDNRRTRCLGGYVGKVLQGDFGPSFKNKDFTVNDLIRLGAPVSLRLGVTAITVARFFGVVLGIFAALRQNKPADFGVMSVAMVGITIPTFVTAPLLTLLLGVYAGILPVGGWNDGAIQNLILPIIVLALPQIAIISRLTRGSMIEVLRSNFVRTARAKGLSQSTVVITYAFRNAMLPVVTTLGMVFSFLLGANVLVEKVFAWPGIGSYAVEALIASDFAPVQGFVLTMAVMYVALNLIIDILYGVIDPRVRIEA